jgi:hypothetical protein
VSGAVCCDPLQIGCRREIGHVAISLTNTPPNVKGKEPCQSCRRKRAMREREQRGLPPWRVGPRTKKATG